MRDEQTVFVVDDDETMRGSLRWLLESLKLNVQTYASAQDFLTVYDPAQPGCLVLDVRMPDISGLQLHEILRQRQIHIPIILITGHGDISMAVHAMKAGAFDFIEKPFHDQALLERIQQGLAMDARQRCETAEREKTIERLNSLTPRESEVLEGVVSGKSNKTLATELGISIKTVEVHRARVMEKMEVDSVAELTTLCLASGLRKGKP
jgi:two-component system, LuxR family, response regulator FixJ